MLGTVADSKAYGGMSGSDVPMCLVWLKSGKNWTPTASSCTSPDGSVSYVCSTSRCLLCLLVNWTIIYNDTTCINCSKNTQMNN